MCMDLRPSCVQIMCRTHINIDSQILIDGIVENFMWWHFGLYISLIIVFVELIIIGQTNSPAKEFYGNFISEYLFNPSRTSNIP